MRIFGIGITVVDHLVEVSDYPMRDTKTKVIRQRKQVGGPVPTALSTAAFYGAQTTLLSRWGDDESGHFIDKELAARGVDTSLCDRSSQLNTGFAHVWVSAKDGARTVAAFTGDFPPTVGDDVPASELAECEILHVDGSMHEAAIAAAGQVKALGGSVVFDAGSIKPGFDRLLPHVDVLIASALFRKHRFGDGDYSREDLLALGPSVVITTDGDQGATCYYADRMFREPAVKVEAVDTNGAGDIFSGAILLGLSRKWPLEKAVRFANRVAGFACQEYGNDILRSEERLSQN